MRPAREGRENAARRRGGADRHDCFNEARP